MKKCDFLFLITISLLLYFLLSALLNAFLACIIAVVSVGCLKQIVKYF